jgi:Protein kinase domain
MEPVLAGRYELEVALGRGASGEVWRGRDLATRRPVAVKLVELSRIDDPGLVAETIGRFRREATVIASLRHPNIVTSLDAGRVGNQLFMIMELAPGLSLASMMDERGARGIGLFPVASVLRLAEQVCNGLAAAHEAGVVHRDIKPANLVATQQLDLKIIDFGIARLLADNSPRLTLQGHTVGTVAYMSPEQAQGDEVDGRADLYSLGCVLYQLLSGRLPFRSNLPSALMMMQVMDQAEPLSAIRPDLPPGLPELVSDLMEKDRGARPQSAAEVADRIAAIGGGTVSGGAAAGGAPAHEADRRTVRAVDPADEPTPPVPVSASVPPARPETVGVPPWELQQTRAQPVTDPRAQPVPSQMRAGGGGAPAWPTGPERRSPRPRRRWRAALSTLVTVAIAAGVLFYVWHQSRGKLVVTGVSVTAPSGSVGCDGTAAIVGTITTNGHGGPITYKWTHTGESSAPVQQAVDASGSDTVTVQLKWTLHGKKTTQPVAKLQVLTPQPAGDSVSISYHCAA